jgi:hypothetical protein
MHGFGRKVEVLTDGAQFEDHRNPVAPFARAPEQAGSCLVLLDGVLVR